MIAVKSGSANSPILGGKKVNMKNAIVNISNMINEVHSDGMAGLLYCLFSMTSARITPTK